MKAAQEKIIKIINSIGGKDAAWRRREALLEAGFEVSDIQKKWNFGRTGTMKEVEGGVLLQIGHATGGRAKSGFGVNACPVVKITL